MDVQSIAIIVAAGLGGVYLFRNFGTVTGYLSSFNVPSKPAPADEFGDESLAHFRALYRQSTPAQREELKKLAPGYLELWACGGDKK